MSLEDAVARLLDSAAPAYIAARCHPCVRDRHQACTGSTWCVAAGSVLACSCDCLAEDED